MSHVDEGELTAYADGAYTPGEPDAERIALHLTECVNCRNRLAQAQALGGRAAEILAVAAPASFAVPSFDELRAAAKPQRRTMRAIPMTWAASVLLAVGLGWFGRDAMLQQQAVTEMARTASQPAESQEMAADAATDLASPPPTSPSAAAPAPAPVASALVPAPERQRSAAAGAEADQSAGRAETRDAARPESDVAGESRDLARVGAATGQSAKVAAAPPPAAALQLTDNVEYITVAEAERRNIPLHRVPELEVLRVGLVGDDVRIEQKLPDGKVVTLLQSAVLIERPLVPRDVPAPAPVRVEEARKSRNAAAEMASVANQAGAVTVVRGSTRVTVSGALSADSLRALAAKVR